MRCRAHGQLPAKSSISSGLATVRINTLMRETMRDPAIVQRLNGSLLEPVIETIAESKAFIAGEVPRHVALLQAAKFEAQ